MLQGLQLAPVEAAPAGLRIVLEDDWVVVIDKPSGLLSVPGKTVSDSVLTRLQARWPSAMLAHRLDQDTSGLLVAGKDMASYVALQKQFLRREIHKRYVAWLDGEVAASEGTIDLSLRVDVDDRPRQIHDPEHGKQAITEWRVLAREAGRTRVSFKPLTGRTHQLRVHAAHRMGLGIPIVGDRLYGRPDVRLFLHAEELSFIHPHHGREVYITAPPPW